MDTPNQSFETHSGTIGTRLRLVLTDAGVCLAVRRVLLTAPGGLSRDALREKAQVSIPRLARAQHELLATGLAERGRRGKLILTSAGRDLAEQEKRENAEKRAGYVKVRPVRVPPEPQVDADPQGLVSFVYFIRAGENGSIKIGHTRNFSKRFKDLISMSPVALHTLGVIEGNRAMEQALHGMFAPDRLHGEWFRPSPRLLAWIARHAVPAPDLLTTASDPADTPADPPEALRVPA